jgi:hypothetical protein
MYFLKISSQFTQKITLLRQNGGVERAKAVIGVNSETSLCSFVTVDVQANAPLITKLAVFNSLSPL